MSLSILMLGGLIALAMLIYFLFNMAEQKKEGEALQQIKDMEALGDITPDSIHPHIEPSQCIGSGACVRACPEKKILSVAAGRGYLTNPLACVGHGACETACPMNAIQLVFGSAKRGVELPRLDPSFQTTRPGVYVVGELGGMGLIRNAVIQGSQAAQHVVDGSRRGTGGDFDAVVVGAGPAGTSATLKLMEAGLNVVMIDREVYGGTIMHYPRAKILMTGTLPIPLFGKVKKKRMKKEELVELWHKIREETGIPIVEGELVEGVDDEPDGMYLVRSQGGTTRRAANVLLALGRRGSPRKLGVPGEESSKVHYRVVEPEEFAGKDMLVVGGGNAAVETALALAEQGACKSVAISYRRDSFRRCRGDNQERISAAIDRGQIRPLFNTTVDSILPDRVFLNRTEGEKFAIANDVTVVQVGGTPPSKILGAFDIETVVKRGER